MVSIIGCTGENEKNSASMRTGSVFNPLFYPPLTRYYFLELQGAVFGLFDRDAGEPERGLVAHDGLLIAADADIYNMGELKRKLGLENKRNITSAEAILLSYIHWNKECVNYLHGDYAFAIWNEQKKELFCARDPLGVRSFYYGCFHDTFVFSSELRPLKNLYPNTLKLNESFFLDTLVTHISEKNLTAFDNIFRLPPGHYLSYFEGRTTIVKYWEPDISKEIRLKSPSDYYEMLRENLKRAVAERISSDSANGSELSGGLDSSLITAMAFDESKKKNVPFYALSNTLGEKKFENLKDEREFILKVIENQRIPWVEVFNTNRSLIDLMHHQVRLQGAYIQQRFGMFNDMLYQKASEKGVKYLFSGFGGDELLSARMSVPWNDILADGNWKTFFSLLKFRKNPAGAIYKAVKYPLKYFGWDIITPGYTYGIFNKSLLEKRFSSLAINNEFSEKNKLWNRYREKYKRENVKYLSQKQLQRISHPHIPQRLEYCYTSAAFYNVQYRYPLLDKRLIESYFSVPAHIRYGADGNRWLFRNLMKEFVAAAIYNRNDKSGVTIPYIQPKLIAEKDLLFSLIEKSVSLKVLAEIIDFNKLYSWYEKLVMRNDKEKNYLMPGAFYSYLVIMVYFNEQDAITGF